jgi:hypothetical protein
MAVRALFWALHRDVYLIGCRRISGSKWNPIGELKFDADARYRLMPKPGMPVYDPARESNDDF